MFFCVGPLDDEDDMVECGKPKPGRFSMPYGHGTVGAGKNIGK